MMMDQDIVAVSPATVYRVLKQAGCYDGYSVPVSSKDTGFRQPLRPHDHWHVDVSYLDISGTFYYMCFVLDGFSRSIVHWDVRESMKESHTQCILECRNRTIPLSNTAHHQ